MSVIIKSIFWDLDGTLINSEPAYQEASFAAAKKLGISSAVTEIPAGIQNTTVFELLLGENLNERNYALFQQWEDELTDYALQAINGQMQIEHSLELLRYFAKIGLPQVVVSNSPKRMIKHCLTALDITPLIKQVFARDSVKQGKPDPQLYLNALNYVKQAPKECLAFEDSYSGICAAKAANLNVVGVGIASKEHEPHLVCDFAAPNWLVYLEKYYSFVTDN